MRNLLRFILKHHFPVLFVLFEIFSIFLLVQNNNYHKAVFFNSTQYINGSIHKNIDRFKKFLNLRNENERLIKENYELRNDLIYYETNCIGLNDKQDFLGKTELQYEYQPARVINNSVNKQYNYITLNKGSQDGINQEMGVISSNGVVGITLHVSKHFSTVISLLNRDFSLSSKIKGSNYFGSITWEGKSYDKVRLKEIPFHVELSMGDTIITSGYSDYFPEGIIIGTISEFFIEGGNYYNITVDLSTDFKNLTNIYVIKNFWREEKIKLEEENN